MTGALVSLTFTAKLQVLAIPALLLAEQFTVVGPTGKFEPEAGVQVTGSGFPHESTALTLKFTGVPAGPAQSAFTVSGQVITGAVLVVSTGGI
jgi:hypothetical protein